ncbi:hypothetical protein VTK56DRAFT_2837 [Thermocarpiscus australiensis]
MTPEDEIRSWTRQVGALTYTCSTDPRRIQLDAVNAAFASDMVYWAKPLPPEALKRCVDQSLCFGLYVQKEKEGQGDDADDEQGAAADQKEKENDTKPEMVGLARLVTDYVTYGYLTDVYVLAEHQGKGLARWMMRCLDEVLASWPSLRRCMLLTRDAAAVRLYRETIGALDLSESSSADLFVLERPGTAVKAKTKADGER